MLLPYRLKFVYFSLRQKSVIVQTLSAGKYFGSTIKHEQVNGIVLTEKFHAAGERVPRHAHENTYICTILDGNWEKEIRRKNISCSPLKSIYHNPGEEHADKFIQGSRVFDIEIDNSWHEFLRSFYKTSNASTEYYNDEITWLAAKIFHEFRNSHSNSDLLIEETAITMLAKISRRITSQKPDRLPPSWLVNIKEYIEEHYDQPISFKSLSMEYDIHPVHLSRTFKSFYKYNLGEYQRLIRIKAACEKLIKSNNSLPNVAVQSGFYDQSHFYRVFKNQTGLLPFSFRKIFIS